MSDIQERVASLEVQQANLNGDLHEIKTDVKEILADMNKARGWAAACMLMAGAIGGLVGSFIK